MMIRQRLPAAAAEFHSIGASGNTARQAPFGCHA